jgi:hypothetical protein
MQELVQSNELENLSESTVFTETQNNLTEEYLKNHNKLLTCIQIQSV